MKTLLPLLLLVVCFSCKKNNNTGCNNASNNCYDAQLELQYKTIMCTQDCPGITGCDGKFYCNECIAAQHGIRVCP